MIKLTPKQWELVGLLDEGAWLVSERMPSGRRIYMENAEGEITRVNIVTFCGVEAAGYLRWFRGLGGKGRIGLSTTGRAALAARKAEPAEAG